MKEFQKGESHLYQYLPCSDRDLNWGMAVTGAGHQNIAPGEDYGQNHPGLYSFTWDSGRTLDELQMVYIVKGQGYFEAKGLPREDVSAGMIIMLKPGEWHRYRPTKEVGWMEYWVGIKGPHVLHLLSNDCIPKGTRILKVGIREDLIQLYAMIETQLKERSSMVQQVASSAALMILTKAMASHKNQMNQTENQQIKQATVHMIQHADGEIDLHHLSDELHLSYDQFRHRFREYTGLSPRQYHLQLKIQRARELLNQTNLSVKDISEKLCFESPFYFSRLFKTKMGRSPQQWRQSFFH